MVAEHRGEPRGVLDGSRWVVIGFAVGSIGLALVLGYAISWSVIEPVKQMDARLQRDRGGRLLRARRRCRTATSSGRWRPT